MIPVRVPEAFGPFLLLEPLGPARGRRESVETSLALRLGDASGRLLVVKRPRLGERPSGEAARRVAREAEVLDACSRRAPEVIARLEAKGELAGLPFVATEFVRGPTLGALLRPGARGGAPGLPGPAALALARDLALALEALHAAGWVHGDLAPGNVVLGDEGRAVLLDFGAACRVGEARPSPAGTPGYAAPEVPAGRPASGAEDVYALGVVVAEALTGSRLFPERELAEAAARSEPPRAALEALSALPAPAGEVLVRALARDPGARPPTGELSAALAEALASGAGGARASLAALAASLELEPPASEAGGLTPTAPMVVGPVALADASAAGALFAPAPPAPSRRAAAASVEATLPMELADAPAPASPEAPRGAVPRWAALSLAAATLVAGLALGRMALRPGASIDSVAPLPRRVRVELDGRPFHLAPGRPVSVAPGRYRLSVVFPKGEALEHEVSVPPRGQLLLVPVARPARAGADESEAEGETGELRGPGRARREEKR